MSLPVSQYEALLAEVRGLRQTAQRVQQLARPLLQGTSNPSTAVAFQRREYRSPSEEIPTCSHLNNDGAIEPLDYTMESLLLDRQHSNGGTKNYDLGVASSNDGEATCSDEDYGGTGTHRCSTKMSVSSEPAPPRSREVSSLYHGTWPVEKVNMWNSEPIGIGVVAPSSSHSIRSSVTNRLEVNSVMSFASSSGGVPLDRVLGSPEHSKWSSQQLEAKMDVVHSLLAMLGCQEHVNMGETLLALSTCPESCLAMRQSGCIPLLVQLVQSDRDSVTRKKASQALHNLVNSQPDEKLRKRESKVLKLLEQCSAYTEALKNNTVYELPDSSSTSEDSDKHPVQTVAHLMKLSFDEGHRQAICQLGGLHTIAYLVETEHSIHGSISTDSHCILMRRYACMALTNLTFGDSGNKALLCSFREFMRALVVQLQSGSDELRQVTASVLRNLSWRADTTSKEILREVGSVTGLMKVAMLDNKENTLKSILSALWNLSAHCTENKSEICAVDGALGFLVDMLTYKTPSKSLAIIENSGGILRNISSQIAVREDYREILRKHNCLQILLDQLKSPSLPIVSNACGTLWNLSAKSAVDQETLWQMGAPAMLRSLNHSKHKMISMGSSAALKNLLNARPQQTLLPQMDSTALALDLPALPTLGARKQKALLQDLDQNLSETYENIEKDSPIKKSDKDDTIIDFIQDSRHKSKGHTTNLEYVDEINLSTNFASLNLNEPSTSYSNNSRPKSRIPQGYSSSSLPYISPSVKRTNPCTYIPVRNKFSDCGYADEIEISDQPIDYSQKYAEIKLPNNDVNSLSSSSDRDYSFGKPKPEKESFSIYAETDLDQPTDYSLRYAEDDSDSDICGVITKNEPQEYIQDTIKTYCTEGTPYETPFNFSTATSMSDLRLDEKPIIDNDKLKENDSKNKKATEDLEEKDHCSTEDISEMESRPKLNDKVSKSELSSGLMSPEKPINYCEEGTPGYFSRVSSFGSLTSIPANEPIKIAQKQNENNSPLASENPTLIKRVEKTPPKTPSEAKAVKFERVVNYAEETPLMFSRSSSLASLDSIEQHSIHDDRSSVVSDFSRLTSGIVSPSELPDSPTQTVPPSPKPHKASIDFPSTSKSRIPSDGRAQRVIRSLPKPSVFEDNITKFKEENTPIQFSTATSLSSLTIDDQVDHNKGKNCIPPDNSVEGNVDIEKDEEIEKKDAEKETNTSDGNDEFVPESEDDGDEDILAACISIGMQNSSAEQSKLPTTSTPASKLPRSNYKFGPKTNLNSSSIPLACSSSRVIRQSIKHPKRNDDVLEYQKRDSERNNHVLQEYSIEESPALLSCTGSNSDISLCNDNKGGRKGDYLSDESSSNLSGDNDHILAECIQSGMPKASKNNPKSTIETPASCLPCRNIQTVVPEYNNSLLGNGNLRGNEANKVSDVNRRDNSLPPYFSARDEVASYAVENSPCHFSLRSSLSDLTVDGSVAGLKSSGVQLNQRESSTNRQSSGISTLQQVNKKVQEQNASRTEQSSRRNSLSSISVESLGSLEAEQALLEQCISSGKPKSKSVSPTKPLEIPDVRSNLRKMGKPQSRTLPDSEILQSDDLESRSKNVSAASVAGSTTLSVNEEVCPDMSPAAAGVEENPELGTKMIGNQELCQEELEKIGTLMDGTSPGRCSIEETLSTGLMKSGSNKSLSNIVNSNFENMVIEDCLARSCEDSKHVDNRMLDPDAMIESLDRFTAELVSQASHLNKDDDRYKVSTGDNTWNEDTSPAEVTFPSISGSAPNVITFSNEDDSCKLEFEVIQHEDAVDGDNKPSNDFSSINTSTMTDSTLIAFEASKMATVFKNEAEMSISITSAMSIELDHVQPPSNLNSLTNSAIGLEKNIPASPKLATKKKLLSGSLMVRKALNNSLNHGSSLESLENRSLSNLDHINPPSDLLYDMEGSMTSIASLPCENDQKMGFLVNGSVRKELSNISHPIFNVKQPFMGSNFSCNELENINPPSLFNEITEFCNSLADVPSEVIGSETEVFEDCYTHIADTLHDDNITLAEDDVTEFSDAQSGTPLQSEVSSPESTPKRTKNLSKSMMTKQRRNLLRDRYKTYTVAAEMVMREEEAKHKENNEKCEDVGLKEEDQSENTTYVSPTYNVEQPKLTPKEKRQTNRFRFETQVLDKSITKLIQQPVIETPPPESIAVSDSNSCSSSPAQSPARSKSSIRNSFMQKRLENKDRFKTQTLSESSFSPDISISPTPENSANHMQWNLKTEADLVLKSLHDTKITQNEFLDCETLSLVSNDDDSEHNSGGSVNYRTYHKSWGIRKNNMPVVNNQPENSLDHNLDDVVNSVSEDENEEKTIGRPKIVKPSETQVLDDTVNEEEIKGVRGRRKPLYSKSNINNKIAPKNIKPAKTMTSNLVKNVTATLKSGTSLKSVASKQIKTFGTRQNPTPNSRISSGYGSKPVSNTNSPKTSPARASTYKGSSKQTPGGGSASDSPRGTPPMERQGTFTKDDASPSGIPKPPSSKIPTPMSTTKIPTSKIARSIAPTTSRIPTNNLGKPPTSRNGFSKSVSSDRANKNTTRIYNRSTSADSREPTRKIQASPSTQSLKSDGNTQNGAQKKTSIPSLAQRSASNSSLNSNGTTSSKKQVTSKIASLWKKIENTKKQPPKKDTRQWIQPEPEPRLIRSNTFDNKDGVIMRNQPSSMNGDATKRISRLGSFVMMDDNEEGLRLHEAINAATVTNV